MSDRPDELRRQLATLWRAARTGFDSMREVVVRSSQAGRLRLDIAMLKRERSQLLEQLGERTCDFIDSASGDIPDGIIDLHDRIRDLEGRIRRDTVRATDNAFGAPRGFEPEAAVDYGDDAALIDAQVEDVDGPDGHDEPAQAARPSAPAAKRKGKRPAAKRKGNAGG